MATVRITHSFKILGFIFLLFFLFCSGLLSLLVVRSNFRSFTQTAIQFRAEPGPILGETSLKSDLTSADSGLQLDLEIALSGFPAKDQPHGLFQPGRRYVETSGDVIDLALKLLP